MTARPGGLVMWLRWVHRDVVEALGDIQMAGCADRLRVRTGRVN